MHGTALAQQSERLIVPAIEALGSAPRAILAVALLLAAAGSLGRWLVGPSKEGVPETGWPGRFALHSALGLNLIGLLGIVQGQFRWLSGNRPAGLLAACLVIGLLGRGLRRPAAAAPVSAKTGSQTPPSPKPGWGLRLGWLLAGIAALLTLGPALTLPAGWDELVYHMPLPRRWLASGGPEVYGDLPYSAFPSLAETLFWLMGPIESLIAPRLLSWSASLLAIGLLGSELRRRMSPAAALALTLAFGISPAVLLVGANCYVESFQLLSLAAWFALVLRDRSGQPFKTPREAVCEGILIGGAAAVKLNGLVWLLLPPLFELLESRTDGPNRTVPQPQPARSRLLTLGLTLAVALAVATPFYLRPWRATGNPFSPYFAEWFSQDAAQLETSRYHHALASSFGVRSPATFVAAPILLAWNDRLYDGSFGWQSLFLLPLAGAALLSRLRGERTAALPLAAIVLLLYGAWYATAQQARFLAPASLVVTLLAGMGWSRLGAGAQAWCPALLVAASLVSLPWRTAGYYLASWETLAGNWTWSESVDDGTDSRYVPLVQALADRTPPEARLLLVFEHRTLYLPRPAEIGTPFFQAEHRLLEAASSPAQLAETLRRGGFTHLVLARSPIGPDRAADWWERTEPLLRAIEQGIADGTFRTLWESETHLILEPANSVLPDNPSPPPPRSTP